MIALVEILPLLLLLGVAYFVGWRAGQASALRKNDTASLVNRGAVLETESLMNMRDRLAIQASEHIILGETFPVIVLDEINKQRREIGDSNKRNEIK